MKSTVFGEKASKPIGSYNQAVRARQASVCLRTTVDWGEFPARATVGAELKAEALVEVSVVA